MVRGFGAGRPERNGVGAVGQVQHDNGGAGRVTFEGVDEAQQRIGAAGVADGGGQRVGVGAHLAADRLHRPAGAAGDDQLGDVAAGQLQLFEQAVERTQGGGGELTLAEALLPGPGVGLVGQAPAIEKLARGAGRAEKLAQQRPVGLVAEQHRSAGVAAVGLVGRAGQAGADVGGGHQHPLGAAGGGDERADAGAGGAAEVECGNRLVESQRGVDHPGVGLLQVGRLGRGEPQRLSRERSSPTAWRPAATPRVEVSSS
nr:hypothetical protein [Candidatus Microthrix sp.]